MFSWNDCHHIAYQRICFAVQLMTWYDFASHHSILLLGDAYSKGLLAFLQDVRTAISQWKVLDCHSRILQTLKKHSFTYRSINHCLRCLLFKKGADLESLRLIVFSKGKTRADLENSLKKIMASTVSECCGFCYNHVTLINNVYPTLPGEEGPRGSALSLVIFYATSKPHKLPKIGAYLEKRARSDARAGRYG